MLYIYSYYMTDQLLTKYDVLIFTHPFNFFCIKLKKKCVESFFLLKLWQFYEREKKITSTFVSKYPGISSEDFLSVILLLYNLLFSLLISAFSPSIEADRNWLTSLLQFTNWWSEYYDQPLMQYREFTILLGSNFYWKKVPS